MSILSDYKNKNNELRRLVKELQEVIYDEHLSWESKYDCIFGAHKSRVEPALKAAGLNLDYYDPDTTYEEDVCAYVNALEELVNNQPN